MDFRRHARRPGKVAFAVLAFTALGLTVPILVSDMTSEHAPPGSVIAAIRNSYAITEPVRLLSSPALDLQSGTISISPRQAARARTGEAVSTLLESGSARLVLDSAVVRLGNPHATAGGTPSELAPMLRSLIQFAFDGLSLKRSSLIVSQKDGADIVLSNVDAEITIHRKGVVAQGSFEYRGQRLSFDTTLGTLDRKTGSRIPLSASVKGDHVEAEIDGGLVVGTGLQIADSQVLLTSPDLRRMANWLGAGWPSGPGLGLFRAEGVVDWADHVIAFQKAAFTLDGNQATGTLTFSFNGQHPDIEGTLALPRLDITRYLGLDDTGSATTKAEALFGWPLAWWITQPSSYSTPLLPLIDADLRISAAKVTAGPLQLGRSAATLSLKSGRLLADIAEMEIDQGSSARGQIAVDMSGKDPRYAVRGKIDGLETSRLTTAMLGHLALRGRAEVTLDLAAEGETTSQMAHNLSGKATLSLPQGGQIGIDVGRLMALAARTPQALPPAPTDWSTLLPSNTALDRLDARVQVANGTWKADLVNATTSSHVVSMTGSLSLPTGIMDVVVARGPLPKEQGAAQKADITSSLNERVMIRGPWRNPIVITDSTDTATSPTFASPSSPVASAPARSAIERGTTDEK